MVGLVLMCDIEHPSNQVSRVIDKCETWQIHSCVKIRLACVFVYIKVFYQWNSMCVIIVT